VIVALNFLAHPVNSAVGVDTDADRAELKLRYSRCCGGLITRTLFSWTPQTAHQSVFIICIYLFICHLFNTIKKF